MRFEIVVLAAGASRRFGEADKLLAEVGGVPIIVRSVRTATAVHADGHRFGVSVVTGANHAGISAALAAAALLATGASVNEGSTVRLVPNARAAEGIGSSIAAGIASLPETTDGAFILPGDMPGVRAATIVALASAFAGEDGRRPVYPARSDGGQANPVLWPRHLFGQLRVLSGDKGGKALLQACDARAVPLNASMEAHDIDTPDDLAHFEAAVAGRKL